MNLAIINDAINALENEDTNYENVSELAMLYIVRDNLTTQIPKSEDVVEQELSDLFPCYQKYCDAKTDYQLGKLNEGEVIHALRTLCAELREFVNTLFSNTDMNKERLIIIEEISKIYEKIKQ